MNDNDIEDLDNGDVEDLVIFTKEALVPWMHLVTKSLKSLDIRVTNLEKSVKNILLNNIKDKCSDDHDERITDLENISAEKRLISLEKTVEELLLRIKELERFQEITRLQYRKIISKKEPSEIVVHFDTEEIDLSDEAVRYIIEKTNKGTCNDTK